MGEGAMGGANDGQGRRKGEARRGEARRGAARRGEVPVGEGVGEGEGEDVAAWHVWHARMCECV